ncbi:MAG TPA: GNAT family N-acetyltransferase [Acidimicrobiales bacterium]
MQMLRQDHAPALLKFELENREYFSSVIPDRGDEYFEFFEERLRGVLALQENGSDFFHVLLSEDGSIVGRVNLFNLREGSAEVGYRIARRSAGKGLATAAVGDVCKLAASKYGLRHLTAKVTLDNKASIVVLARNGFTPIGELSVNDKPAMTYGRAIWSHSD